jgi:uncharacterized membrane protein
MRRLLFGTRTPPRRFLPRRGVVCAVVAALLLAACSSSADLVVSVVDGDGNPIPGATISVQSEETHNGTTDASGAATLSGISGEIASVSVEADGFFPETADVALESGENE